MTARRPCSAAPGPLEEYAARFDDLFSRVAQRRGFRETWRGCCAAGPEQDADGAGRGRAGTGAQQRRSRAAASLVRVAVGR